MSNPADLRAALMELAAAWDKWADGPFWECDGNALLRECAEEIRKLVAVVEGGA